MLEASPEDVEFKDGEFIVAKSNKKKTIGEIAFACYLPGVRDEMKSPLPEGEEPGLKETAFFDPSNFSFPAGTHIAEVEICLLYTSPSPRDVEESRMPSSA